MSDQPPTRPKPGSLRDRIAAFENQAASQAAPPPPRPKPGGLQQWKPRQPPPTTSSSNDAAAGITNPASSTISTTSTTSASATPSTPPTSSHGTTPTGSGSGNSMSASDARESIKQGGSLKERMAALQGKAAFGGGGGSGSSGGSGESAVPKPKWKPTLPPPQVPVDEKEEKQLKEEEQDKEEKIRTTTPKTVEDGSGEPSSSPPPPSSSSPSPQAAEDVNPEDEERQRRAAIAARMAKLGGARVGMMGPPLGMFAANKSPPPPPPVFRQQKSETVEPSPAAKEEEKEEEKRIAVPTLSETISTDSTPSLPSPPSHSKSPPLSMPVPAVPRRTAPPRRKPPKSPVPSAPPTPTPDAQVPAVSAEVGTVGVAGAETQEVLTGVESLTKDEKREVEVPPVEEVETMESLVADAAKVEEMHEHEPQQVEEKTFYTHAEEEPESEKNQMVEEPSEVAEPLHAEELENEQEEELKEEEPEAKDEEQEDEEARRKRISDRLAKMGGINPLFAPPPISKRSSLRDEVVVPSSPPPQLPPFRRLSTDSFGSVSIGGPARRSSVDSVKEVELGVVKGVESGIPEQNEQVEEEGDVREEHVEEEHVLDDGEEEESNDILDASTVLETPPRHNVEEGEEDEQYERDTAPAPPPRPLRGSSGFVTRPPPLSDDEQHEYEEEEAGEESPPPLPVSPRFASMVPRAAASFSSQFSHRDSEEHDVLHQDSAKPVPVPHRSLSLRSSVLSTLSKYSQDEEDNKGDDVEHAEEEGEEEEKREKEEEEDKVRHVPPPPTRQVPLPPPPPPPADEGEEQHTHTEPKQGCDEPLIIPPPTIEKRHSKDDSDSFEDVPLPHPILVRQSQALTVRVERSAENEIMDDEEGDPIDPSFITPKRLSALLPPFSSSGAATHRAESQEETREPDSNSSDMEAAKKQTIAERMAKLGGIRFGVAPVPGLPVRPLPPMPAAEGGEVKETEEAKEGGGENEEVDEEEEERARKERIAAKLAGMGGMRIGMMPTMGFPPRPAQRSQAPAVQDPISSPVAPSRAPPARPPPIHQTPTSSHDGDWEHDSATTPSEDGVKVEMEESEMEEVHHEDAKLDGEESEHEDGEIVSPPLPPHPRVFAPRRQPSLSSSSTPQPLQSVRPPIPSTAHLVKRSSLSGSTMASSMSIGRKSSSGSTGTASVSYRPTVTKGQSDYVMVEEPQTDSPIEEQISSFPPPPTRPPPPPQRTATTSHSVPPAPAISDSISSQWELPSIPSGSLGFGLPIGTGTGTDLELSWTDAMDEGVSRSIPPAPGTGSHFHRYPPTHAPPSHPAAPAPSTLAPSYGSVLAPTPVDLSADDLMAVWGRVGVQVCETATTMYEKAKKALVGDGTYAGFVRGVLSEVPNALKPAVNDNNGTAALRWGYVVYAQNGSVVQRRISDILPGDVVEMVDARFKGHKGLQSYTLQVGTVGKEIFVGVVAEYEPKKSKLKVLQANQHVGQQTVESVTYRLDDLKSGALKVYRVLEAL